MQKRGGLYIHIPFCHNKCIYCDFYSAGERIADWENFIIAVLNELNFRIKEIDFEINTIYIGGGTPSLIPEKHFINLIEGIKSFLKITYNPEEFTIEVNPEDITEKKCEVWKNLGVNRVSMGVQSFIDKELKFCKRRHSSRQVFENYSLLKKFFDNISLDLIFGLPYQTTENWKYNLDNIVELRPQHISAYSLMIENKTALNTLIKNGKVYPPSEKKAIEFADILFNKMDENGYYHYEISNFSLHPFESKHNLGYWKGRPYLGLGPSAHSYDGYRKRSWNPADIKEYINYFGSKKEFLLVNKNFYNFEYLSNLELKEEYIMTRLRLKEGISLTDFTNKFNKNSFDELLKKAEKHIYQNNLSFENNRLSLTLKGLMISDLIIVDLI